MNADVARGHRASLTLALLAAFLPPTIGARPPVVLPLTEPQIRALDLRWSRPEPTSEGLGAPRLARIVIDPLTASTVYAPAEALIDRLSVVPGQSVSAGAPMVELHSAEAAAIASRQREAELLLIQARRDLERDRRLHAEGLIPGRRLEHSQTQFELAQSAVTTARAEAIRLTTDRTAARDGRFTLTAPHEGIVARIGVQPGQRVQRGEPLLDLVSREGLVLELELPLGTPIPAVGEPVHGEPGWVASVRSVDWPIDPQRRSRRLLATLPPGHGLAPGEPVRVRLGRSGAPAWRLPERSVIEEGGQAWVFRRVAEGVEAVPVTVARRGAEGVLLTGALHPGDEVATNGTIALKGLWRGHGGE